MKKSTVKFLILILLLIVLVVGAYAFDIWKVLQPEVVRTTVQNLGLLGPVVFVLLYVVIAVTFLPTSPFVVVGGALFGTIAGSIYSILGATLGSLVMFVAVRFLGKDFVDKFLKNRYPKLYSYDEKLAENGLFAVTALRLASIFPLTGLTIALALTRVRFVDFLLGTFLGVIPSVIVLSYLGSSLATLNTLHIIISGVLFLLLLGSYPLYRKYKKNQK
tara:strand:- start:82 stop:735 length:654 start_codon:yes stop_codon:yes gene_type:complete